MVWLKLGTVPENVEIKGIEDISLSGKMTRNMDEFQTLPQTDYFNHEQKCLFTLLAGLSEHRRGQARGFIAALYMAEMLDDKQLVV
ncbi:MAG: hypothetical protein FWE04_05330 [Oscillospiraceae bacterium]|nr:hypothetical protein [Oscillospiraceae bacterium]